MYGATCFSGAAVDKVSFNLPSLGGRPPLGGVFLGSGEPCVKRGTIPKELVDGLAVELQVKGHRVPRNGKSSQLNLPVLLSRRARVLLINHSAAPGVPNFEYGDVSVPCTVPGGSPSGCMGGLRS